MIGVNSSNSQGPFQFADYGQLAASVKDSPGESVQLNAPVNKSSDSKKQGADQHTPQQKIEISALARILLESENKANKTNTEASGHVPALDGGASEAAEVALESTNSNVTPDTPSSVVLNAVLNPESKPESKSVLNNKVPNTEENSSLISANKEDGAGTSDIADGESEDPKEGFVSSAERRQELAIQAEIRLLRNRDREVRAHEQAHAAVGGQYAGAPRYEYSKGPDGVLYATSGEVSIDTGKISGDPEATLQKAQKIAAAANAPAEPSSQDRAVAAKARQMAAQARVEIAALRQEQSSVKEQIKDDEDQDEENKVGDGKGASRIRGNEAGSEKSAVIVGDEDSSAGLTSVAGKKLGGINVILAVAQNNQAGGLINSVV